jgi:16S rRNA (cytidine1402-2'-O)-methyltransferase
VPGRLILCATPIGNLGDASPRLAAALTESSLIFAEDTRRSKILLDALGVKRPLRSYFAGNEDSRAHEFAERLRNGETLALVTDAGTPAISDPGLSAVRIARAEGAVVSVIPGPSALTAALAVSGLPSERFVFEGFLPRKGGDRTARLQEISNEARTVVLFSGSSHLLTDLADLSLVAGDRPLCIARELTKAFEEIEWTTPTAALEKWGEGPIRGEFTLVLGGGAQPVPDLEEAIGATLVIMDGGQAMTAAVRQVAAVSGVARRALYEAVLARTRGTSHEQ